MPVNARDWRSLTGRDAPDMIASMQRVMLKSKIHRARVTGSDLHYVGSLTVDPTLLAAADILEHERIAVVDVDNGARFDTYAILGEPDSGVIEVNGAAARLVHHGDTIIIFAYGHYDEDEARRQVPSVVHVDECNRIVAVDERASTLVT
jgi:aspartate 1-decarboxylase